MAMQWKVKAVEPELAEIGIPWEPFAVLPDGSVLCKTLVEVENDKSSTLPGNENWAGNEPDANGD